MRPAPWTVALLLLPSLLALTPTSGAAAGEAPLLTDAEGDPVVRAGPDGTELPVPLGQDAKDADLLTLAVHETEDSLRLVLGVKSVDEDSPGITYYATFSWGGQDYRAWIWRYPLAVRGNDFRGEIQVEDGGDWSSWIYAPVEVDAAAGTLAVGFAKLYVLDVNGRVPGKGDELTGITVTSRRALTPVATGGWAASAHDEMGLDAPATYVLQKGDFATGSLRLDSPDRVRVSNGGATTFVFKVHVQNVGQQDEEFALGVTDVPEGWQARVQSPLRVPAGDSRTIAVLASVPFAHDHGGFDAFNLTVQGQRDPASQGRMRLGVLHTPIPQPAGHHPELYLHVWKWAGDPLSETWQQQTGQGWPYMNTVADHADDAPDVAPNVNTGEAHVWSVWLSPSLRMGLDFDLDLAASLAGTIVPKLDGAATLEARLWYWTWESGDSERTLLAEGAPVDLALARDRPATFEVALAPTPESDYVPYTRRQNVQLELTLTPEEGRPMPTWGGDPLAPRLRTEDFVLRLPLLEYHDRLSGEGVATSALDLVAEGQVEKHARPGTLVTYAFEIRNPGATDLAVALDVAGGDAALGALAPASRVTVPAAGSARVTLAVEVPREAAEGQELEVLVFAHAVDDPAQSAVSRTKTTVTLGEAAVSDERAVFAAAQEEAETPGAGALGAIAAALAAAAVLRRRR